MSKLIKLFEGLSARDFADIFKEIFNADSNIFTEMIQGSIVAQQEITMELEFDE